MGGVRVGEGSRSEATMRTEPFLMPSTLSRRSLFTRIVRAHKYNQQYKVLVSIPLVPGMCGQIKGDGFSGIGCVMHFQFRTMSHGGQSLYERLRKRKIDPENYIFITGLRTHQEVRAEIECLRVVDVHCQYFRT